MKYKFKILHLLAVVALALCSCVREYAGSADADEGQPAVITLATPSGRAGVSPDGTQHSGSQDDYGISEIRVLGFRTKDAVLAFNRLAVLGSVSGTLEETVRKAHIEVLTGSYTFVFVANGSSDSDNSPSIATKLQNLTVGTSRLSDLKDLSFGQAAFQVDDIEASYTGRDIPMSAIYENVVVVGDNTLLVNDQAESLWKIKLERIGVRLDISVDLTMAQFHKWQSNSKLIVENFPASVPLIQAPQNNPAVGIPRRYNASGLGAIGIPGMVRPDPDGTVNIRYDRIIIPEALFTDTDDPAAAVRIGLEIDGKTYSAVVGKDLVNTPKDYTLPRNHYVAVKATVKESDPELDLTLTVRSWDDMALGVDIDGPYKLWVEKTKVELPGEAGNLTLDVETTYEGIWSAVLSDDEHDPSAAVPNWIKILNDPNLLENDQTLQIEYEINDTGAERTAYLYITAGRFTKVITIVQAEDDNPLRGLTLGTTLKYPELTYVGAFWRNEQTGERLIRIPVKPGMDGKWLAMVVSSTATNPPSNVIDAADTWIRLDGDPSGDGDLWQDGREPADMYNSDHIYRLPDDADTWVKGDAVNGGYIYFRIGLTTPLASGAAPQYGVVRLYYNDYTKYQDIFIRHGHDADYLMRPGDGSGNGALSSRPNAKRYSPYNLTSAEYLASAGASQKTGGTNISGHSQIGTRATGSNNAAFTEYPTQAGAYFQWANATYPRYAWHPTYVSGNIPWNSNYPKTNNDYWTGSNNLGATHETCPPGYRRPNDGITNAAEAGNPDPNIIAISEQRQSLWWDPVVSKLSSITNVIWGYYADGFFDRYNIVTSLADSDSQPNSAVSVDDYRVAYIGGLFFNPLDNASLFFPAAGYRYYSNGQLSYPGFNGFFWSSTGLDHSGWYLTVGQGTAIQSTHLRSCGVPIRCVVDE